MTRRNREIDQDLRRNFDRDKEALLHETKKYLTQKPVGLPWDWASYNDQAANFLKDGDFTSALQLLEIARDARSGIASFVVPVLGATPILIRDARACEVPPRRGSEAFWMQYINMIRAAIELAEIEGKSNLETALRRKAIGFIHELNSNLSQDEMSKILNKKFRDLASFLEKNGIAEARDKLNFAKDFQNFNDPHHNIVTISALEDEKGNLRNVVEAEVAFKGLMVEQKDEFENLKSNQELSETQRQLLRRHESAILDGKHVIPTQTKTSLPGIKAFEKITLCEEIDPFTNVKTLQEILVSKHGGTLASLISDVDLRERLTEQNIRQAQIFVGTDATLHCNMLNAKIRPGRNYDSEIVTRVTKANGAKSTTTTAVNLFRKFGAANDLRGAKEVLKKISDAIDPEDFSGNDKKSKAARKVLVVLKNHIQPSGFFGRIKKAFGPSCDKALKRLSSVDFGKNWEIKNVLRMAVALAKDVEEADAIFRFFDGENVSLKVAIGLNRLTNHIRNFPGRDCRGIRVEDLPQDCVLAACTNGKDRTGIKLHLESAQEVANKLGIDLSHVDQKLLAAGASGETPGSVHLGFATLGCFGIKSENRFVFPNSRKGRMQDMLEESATTNKVPRDHFFTRVKKFFSARRIEPAPSFSAILPKDNSAFVGKEVDSQEVAGIAPINATRLTAAMGRLR